VSTIITGGSGNLGRELVKVIPSSLRPSHNELDVTDERRVFEYVKETKPSELIHCAAMIGLRQCEEDKAKAYATNVNGTRNLVSATLRHSPGCLFVYISTASVFDGDRGDYTEEDIPNPKNFYSLAKLLGEFVVAESRMRNYLIVRTNLVARKKWGYPKAFVDRYGTYLFADDLAFAIKRVLDDNVRGLVHVCGKEKLSMFDLAKITTPEVLPTTMKEYVGPALPVDMSLRSRRIEAFQLTR
jgi:dTDP-4-dehydrorhamnose reductase